MGIRSPNHPITRSLIRQNLRITWLGHSAFPVRTPGGKTLLFDPWYTGNPKFPTGQEPRHADLILVSHGPSDHSTDAAAIAKKTGAAVVAIYEITSWLGQKGVTSVQPMNKGGTIEVAGLRSTMTDARHSSSFDDLTYLGEPAGFLVGLESGQTIYFAGDTALFGDMKILGELYRPDIAFLPIGDRFTMGARSAAFACRKFFAFKTILPCHYGTFPGMLDATADAFIAEMKGGNVRAPRIGEQLTV